VFKEKVWKLKLVEDGKQVEGTTRQFYLGHIAASWTLAKEI